MSDNTPGEKSRIVVCIPGTWKDWNELIGIIISSSNGEYVAAGGILMNAKRQEHFSIEFCEPDPMMQTAFQHAGRATGITDESLVEIGNHSSVVYLSSFSLGADQAAGISRAAEALLDCGGLGVKIESAGIAFDKKTWITLCNEEEEPLLYHMFVCFPIQDTSGGIFSCGMHNLGCKDAMVFGVPTEEAIELLNIFNSYVFVENPQINAGETFSLTPEAPRFRITEEKNPPYSTESLFSNPYGMWRLSPA